MKLFLLGLLLLDTSSDALVAVDVSDVSVDGRDTVSEVFSGG